MDLSKVCFGCFRETDSPVCPYCGFDRGQEQPVLALPLGTLLGGRYATGKVLGMGGFGITYLGWDLTLEVRVAIKEYLPSGIAARAQDRYSVSPITQQEYDSFQNGQNRFLEEARTLAKLRQIPNIVSVEGYFRENNTAYFVMDYIDGESLQSYLKSRGGHLPFQETLAILAPVMEALSAVHAQNLIHRDISPDNIFLTTQGVPRLLDFGAAREAFGDEKSRSVILKHGFAPDEQYRTHGQQGPWTDVYAMAATMYFCLTGQLPPDSIDRSFQDTLVPPSSFGVSIPSEAEEALLMAMSVRAEDRFQTMEGFRRALTAAAQAAGIVVPASMPSTAIGASGQSTMYANPSGTPVSTFGSSTPNSQNGAYAQTVYTGQNGVPAQNVSSAPTPQKKENFWTRLQHNKGLFAAVIGGAALVVLALILIPVLILTNRGNSMPVSGGGTSSEAPVSTLPPPVTTPKTTEEPTPEPTEEPTPEPTAEPVYSSYENSGLSYMLDYPSDFEVDELYESTVFRGPDMYLTIRTLIYANVPLYSVEDYENNVETVFCYFMEIDSMEGYDITDQSALSINGISSYGVEYSTEQENGALIMVPSKNGLGGYFLHMNIDSTLDTDIYNAELAQGVKMINSFQVTGKLPSDYAVFNNAGVGCKVIYDTTLCETKDYTEEDDTYYGHVTFYLNTELDDWNFISVLVLNGEGQTVSAALDSFTKSIEDRYSDKGETYDYNDYYTYTNGEYDFTIRDFTLTVNGDSYSCIAGATKIGSIVYEVYGYCEMKYEDDMIDQMTNLMQSIRPAD